MAFIGIIMVNFILIAIFFGGSVFLCAVCFVSAGVIMAKKRKASVATKIKAPWYVIILRIIGAVAAIPIVYISLVIIYISIEIVIDVVKHFFM